MTIDTHVHFYDPKRPQGVPWPNPENDLLYRTVMPDDYQRIAEEIQVDGVVVVEASPWLEDNQWILDLAERTPMIMGFVGNLDLYDEEFPAHIERFSGNPRFCGIRRGRVTAEDLLNSRFCEHVKLLAERDLSLDLLARPKDLQAVAEMADMVPQLTVVLDHVTHVPVTKNSPEPEWITAINTLGSNPNVYCKISGLTESAYDVGGATGDVLTSEEYYRPYLNGLYEAFGAEQLLFATNWPVVDRATSAKEMVDAVMPFFRELGSEVSDKICAQNAVRAYRLQVDPPRR